MWRYMESNTPNTFTHSYERGVEAVLNGSYAFLGESTMLHYLVQVHIHRTKFLLLLSKHFTAKIHTEFTSKFLFVCLCLFVFTGL